MATSSVSPEGPNSPEDAITNRKCSESERGQPNKRDSRETVNDTGEIFDDDVVKLNSNNNNSSDPNPELNLVKHNHESESNNNNNNNKVPRFIDIDYFIRDGNPIGNPNESSSYRPSSVPTYQISHDKGSSRNKSVSESSLSSITNKSKLVVKQMIDDSIGSSDLNKKRVNALSTSDYRVLSDKNALHGEQREKDITGDEASASCEDFTNELWRSQRSADVADDFRDNCNNSIPKTIENDEKIYGRPREIDNNSIVAETGALSSEYPDDNEEKVNIQLASAGNNVESINNNAEVEIRTGLNLIKINQSLEPGDNPNEIVGKNESNFLSNFVRERLNGEGEDENINLKNKDHLDIINLNIKGTLDKFDEKISHVTADVNLNIAKERKFRFRKCYSDSKTCSKIYPIYENLHNVKNNDLYDEQRMESLNVKNLEKSISNCRGKGRDSTKINENTGNQKYKSRKSYHQDVEEALSSLLWQPYEYQNACNKNSDIKSSSSLSSSSSGCSSSSSSCSTISSRGSFRRDLERSNNGPVHRQQSARSGNTAIDLHLRAGEMVNNPAANGYENLLNQWGEVNGSRDAAELSNASRLMVGVSPEVRCLRAVASLERSAYVFCDCDACLSDMRLEVCEDVTPLTSSTALAHETTTQPVSEAGRSNNVTLNQATNQQHLPIGAANLTNMQQPAQRPVLDNGYQRNSLSSVNVVGLPRPIPSTNNNRPSVSSGNGLFTNHPRNASEPIPMVQSNQFKYNSSTINASNVVPILSHQRHSSQIESGNAIHTINHMRSASVPKTVPHAPQKMGESRSSGSDLKVIVGNEQQQQNSQQRQQRLPLNVSNVNVNYYRAVPVNVVSSVPTIQCVNSGESNVSNVNIVQAMPVVNNNNTPNCTYTTCTSSTNYVQNYANLPPQTTQHQNFSFPNPSFNTSSNNQMQIHPPALQQCAITTFGSSIITQHFPSGSTYNLSTPQVPSNVQINANQNIQQSTQTHISYQNSNENNVIQNGTIIVPSVNQQQPTNSHTFSTTEVTVHNPPVSSQIQVVPLQTRPPVAPTSTEVRTRTFTSTEAQTDETAVNSNAQNDSGSNREQRRRERRERRHHRRVNSTNHRHGTNDHGTQWNSMQNERLPDILNSHMPPSYASAVNNGIPSPQSVLPNAIVSNPIVPPGTVVQTMVPNNIVPSGLVGNPIVPFPPPVVPGQVPLVQGAAPVPVPVPAPSGFRFPFPAAGFRR